MNRSVTLIDTSAWIHALRPNGDPEVRAKVAALLESGQAALCPMIRLELWNGARGEHEKAVIRDIERELPELEISVPVWELACKLARVARKKDQTIPATDLVLAACAQHHRVEILHDDSHFTAINESAG